MFLLDTNVVSEARKPSDRRSPAVGAWLDQHDPRISFLSVLTILEAEEGALRLQRRDPPRCANLLAWVEQLLVSFHGRIIPVDTAVARQAASLHYPNPRPEIDTLIAATALVHGLTVVTRDVKDFEPMGVPLLNPWEWVQ